MDLWVMRKSWVHPHTYCYEIKISRSDFLNDKKWRNYLEYCSDFYFVTPPGIIEPNELPNEAGLIVTSVNGKKLYTKKIPVSRLDIEIPEALFRYILMWRAIQKNENEIISRKIYWENWLNNKKIDAKFGHYVSKNINKIIKKEIEKVRIENENLKTENNNLNHIKEIMLKLGFKDDNYKRFYYNTEIKFKKKLEKISQGKEGDFREYIEKTILNLREVLLIIGNENERKK